MSSDEIERLRAEIRRLDIMIEAVLWAGAIAVLILVSVAAIISRLSG